MLRIALRVLALSALLVGLLDSAAAGYMLLTPSRWNIAGVGVGCALVFGGLVAFPLTFVGRRKVVAATG